MLPRRLAIRGTVFFFGAVAVLILAVWLFPRQILGPVGTFLDVGVAPVKAEAAVVLAGGWTGERVLKAGELVKQGHVPYALLSSPTAYYGRRECDYALPFAMEHGYPAESFICVPVKAFSTDEESVEMIAELRRRHIKRVLLVTVSSHTRRAKGFFSQHAPEMEFIPISAASPEFVLSHWYEQRQGRKAIFLEWTKYITSRFGI